MANARWKKKATQEIDHDDTQAGGAQPASSGWTVRFTCFHVWRPGRPVVFFAMHTGTRILLLLALTTLTATAQVTVYRISGTVASVGGDLGSTVQVGNAFQVDFTFDESVALHNNFGSFALYKSMESELQIVTGGSGTLTWTASTPLSNDFNHGFAISNNNSGYDRINFDANSTYLAGPALNGESVSSLYFNLQDFTQTAFASTAIPASLSLGSFGQKEGRLYFDGQTASETINFTLTNIEKNPSAIPEPSTYAAVLGGLALAGVMLRRRFAGA